MYSHVGWTISMIPEASINIIIIIIIIIMKSEGLEVVSVP
jgi:hypothetical protein